MDLRNIQRILDVLEQHEKQANQIINMVPSENSMSALAKLPMLLDVYHRYFFNVAEAPDEWSFRGCQDVAKLETELAIPLLRELTGARYVNLRPLSGLSGMAMVLSALGGGQPSTVLSVSPEQGGHYATAALAARLGLRTRFMTGPDAHTIDYDGVATSLRQEQIRLIYVDQSNCLFPLDVARLVSVSRQVSPDTLIHVDCSHWLGLVLGGQFPNPLDVGADSFGGSTHKTFPGPQKAVVVTDRVDVWDMLSKAQYEMISSHHFASAISLGMAMLEFKECGGRRYALNVVRNTRELGRRLHQLAVDVVGAERGFSSGHQLWIRTGLSGVDAYEAGDRLYRAGLRVNAFPWLPGVPEKVIRIGVNEATYHGLGIEDMGELAEIFAAAVYDRAPSDKLSERVARLRARYSHAFEFPSNDPRIVDRVVRLVLHALAPRDGWDRGRRAQFLTGDATGLADGEDSD
jgi:glycine hydroxymethyltransferase